MKRFSMRPAAVFAAFALAAAAAAPAFGWEWEWNWRMPGAIYKGLAFESRNAVDRAYKATSAALDAERARARPTDLVPRFRAAARLRSASCAAVHLAGWWPSTCPRTI